VVVGLFTLSMGTWYAGLSADRQRDAERRHARAFVQLIESEEQDFLAAMKRRASGRYPGGIEPALTAFRNLEEEFHRLHADAAGDNRLVGVLATYAEALRQWKAGLMLLRQPRADPARAQQTFSRGDQLRADACESFDRLYGPPDR
jgi:DNA-binding GntR family transcriptional regulator